MSAPQFTIKTDPAKSWVHTRNGMPDLIGVHVWACSLDPIVWIEGVGKRGMFAKSGFQLSTEEMDNLCETWLKARGHVVLSTDEAQINPTITAEQRAAYRAETESCLNDSPDVLEIGEYCPVIPGEGGATVYVPIWIDGELLSINEVAA